MELAERGKKGQLQIAKIISAVLAAGVVTATSGPLNGLLSPFAPAPAFAQVRPQPAQPPKADLASLLVLAEASPAPAEVSPALVGDQEATELVPAVPSPSLPAVVSAESPDALPVKETTESTEPAPSALMADAPPAEELRQESTEPTQPAPSMALKADAPPAEELRQESEEDKKETLADDLRRFAAGVVAATSDQLDGLLSPFAPAEPGVAQVRPQPAQLPKSDLTSLPALAEPSPAPADVSPALAGKDEAPELVPAVPSSSLPASVSAESPDALPVKGTTEPTQPAPSLALTDAPPAKELRQESTEPTQPAPSMALKADAPPAEELRQESEEDKKETLADDLRRFAAGVVAATSDQLDGLLSPFAPAEPGVAQVRPQPAQLPKADLTSLPALAEPSPAPADVSPALAGKDEAPELVPAVPSSSLPASVSAESPDALPVKETTEPTQPAPSLALKADAPPTEELRKDMKEAKKETPAEALRKDAEEAKKEALAADVRRKQRLQAAAAERAAYARQQQREVDEMAEATRVENRPFLSSQFASEVRKQKRMNEKAMQDKAAVAERQAAVDEAIRLATAQELEAEADALKQASLVENARREIKLQEAEAVREAALKAQRELAKLQKLQEGDAVEQVVSKRRFITR